MSQPFNQTGTSVKVNVGGEGPVGDTNWNNNQMFPPPAGCVVTAGNELEFTALQLKHSLASDTVNDVGKAAKCRSTACL